MIKDLQKYNGMFYETGLQTVTVQKENEYISSIYCKLSFERKRCCDFGCGTGYWTKILADIGANIIGVDISPDLIAFCKKKDPRGVYLTVQEALTRKFDYIFVNWVFQEIIEKFDMKLVMQQLLKMSKKGTEIYLIDNVYPDIKKAKFLFSDDFGEVFQYSNGVKMRFFPNEILQSLFKVYGFAEIMHEEFGDSFLTCFKMIS